MWSSYTHITRALIYDGDLQEIVSRGWRADNDNAQGSSHFSRQPISRITERLFAFRPASGEDGALCRCLSPATLWPKSGSSLMYLCIYLCYLFILFIVLLIYWLILFIYVFIYWCIGVFFIFFYFFIYWRLIVPSSAQGRPSQGFLEIQILHVSYKKSI